MQKLAIGIDLGGTKVLTALVNKTTGEVLHSVKKKTKKEKGIDRLFEKIVESIKEILEENQLKINQIDSIGIGVPGMVDREKGILISAANLDCENLNVKSILQKEFDVPVFIGNDVEVATIGELYFGSGKKHKDFVCVFVGTGVGSGVVIDGKIRQGDSGSAGEIGHMIVDIGGRPCGCGGNGCLEAYGSRLAVEKRIEGALRKGRDSVIKEFLVDGKRIKTSMLRKAVQLNDELVMRSLDEAAEYLGAGLSSVINFLNPEAVILGGGLTDAIDYFYEQTVMYSTAKSLPVPSKKVKFERAKLGDFSGVIGAALLQDYRS